MYAYNTLQDIARLRDVFDDFFSSVPRGRHSEYPALEVYEGDDVIEIRALVPGVNSGDLNLQLVDQSLVIEGEKKKDYADKPYLRRERSFGSFRRAIKLPYRVNGDSIKAEMKNGILTVTLEKSEDAKPRRIEIH